MAAAFLNARYYQRYRKEPAALWTAAIWLTDATQLFVRALSVGQHVPSETATQILPTVSLLAIVLLGFSIRRVKGLLDTVVK